MRERTTNIGDVPDLTDAEVQVLDLLSGFVENKETADHLGVSIPLVQKRLHCAFEKLRVRTRAEAIFRWKSFRSQPVTVGSAGSPECP